MTGWEVPQIALFELVDEVATFEIQSCDTDLALENICPFSLDVPVEFTDHTLVKSHVDAG